MGSSFPCILLSRIYATYIGCASMIEVQSHHYRELPALNQLSLSKALVLENTVGGQGRLPSTVRLIFDLLILRVSNDVLAGDATHLA